MDCTQAQARLHDATRPGTAASHDAELAEHLRGCSACLAFVGELTQLEAAWRAIPLPAEAEQARAAFLERLPAPAPKPLASSRPAAWPRWVVAAALLLGIGTAAWLAWPTQQAHAADLVEALVEWNINLTQAPTPADRNRIYANQSEALESALQTTDLSADDRELAVVLLATGSRLAQQDHPVDEAGEFNTLADLIVTRLDAASRKAESKRIERLARLLSRVADQGIAANLERASNADPLDGVRQGKWDRINFNNAERAARLTAMLERLPQADRKAVRQALDHTRKHPRKSSAAKLGNPE